MACSDKNDGLHFLSKTAKNKLEEIAEGTANFILISKFKRSEEKWLNANGEAKETVTTLSSLKSNHIFKLVGELYDNCSQLSPGQEKTILKYLYQQTDKKSLACRLGVCIRDFYEPIFLKVTKISRDPNRNSNIGSATEASIQNSERVSYEVSRPVEDGFQYVPVHFQPNGVRERYSAILSDQPIARTHSRPRASFRPRRPYRGYRGSYINNNYNNGCYRSYPSNVHNASGFNNNNCYNGCNCRHTHGFEHTHGEYSGREYQRTISEPNQSPLENNVAATNGPNRMRTCTATLESPPDRSMTSKNAYQDRRQFAEPSTSTSINEIYLQSVVLVSTETESDEPNKFENRKQNHMESLCGTVNDSDTDVECCDSDHEPFEKKYVSF